MKGGGYIGKIANQGSQKVMAPNQMKKTAKGTVKTGSDLRSGKK